jgi:hypothetical protein
MSTTPVITFRVNLSLAAGESQGTSLDSRVQGVLHPDRYVGMTGQDDAVASIAARAGHRVAYLPGRTAAANRYRKHGEVFTETGEDALYMRNMYAIGYAEQDNAFLEVVSQTN